MEDLEKTYDATPERIWELWTTAAGIERWWSPDGFEVRVDELDLRPGGALVYTRSASSRGARTRAGIRYPAGYLIPNCDVPAR